MRRPQRGRTSSARRRRPSAGRRRASPQVAAYDIGRSGSGVVRRHPRRARGRRQRDHPVGGCEHGRAVRDHDHAGCVRASRARVSSSTCSVSSSRWALGSSSSTTGRSASDDAGERDAGPLAGREPGAVLAERRVEAVGEGAHDVGEADAAQGLPHLVVAGARGGRGARWRRWCRPAATAAAAPRRRRLRHQPGSTVAEVVHRRARRRPGRAARRAASPAASTCRSRTGPAIATSPRSGRSRSSGAVSGAGGVPDLEAGEAEARSTVGRAVPASHRGRPAPAGRRRRRGRRCPRRRRGTPRPTRRSGQ